MPTGERRDPYRSFNFRLEIDGLTVGSFRECAGLSADGNVVEYREGTDIPRTARKLIGLQTYSNVTLKRGYTTGSRVTGISGQDTTFWTAVGKSAAALAAFLKQPRQLARPYSTPHAMIPVPKGGQIFCPSPGLPKALRVSKPVAITPPACPKAICRRLSRSRAGS